MDIQLTEELEMLRHSVQRFLDDQYSFEARRKIIASEEGWSRAQWERFAEMGLLAAPFSVESGGFGSSALVTMILMQEFGRRLVIEPFFETVVLAGGLIEHHGSEAQRGEYLTQIAQGKSVWALAWAEQGSRYDMNHVQTTAVSSGDEYLLSGEKIAVIGAPWADKLIVSARTPGNIRDHDDISLFVVDRHSPGLHLQSYGTLDGRQAAEITFENVRGQLLSGRGEGLFALESCRDRAIGALCAESVGIMTELNSVTLDFSKTRKQFGAALGSFQALQHRMVDMFIGVQEAVSLMQHLTLSLVSGDPKTSKLASGAKAKISYVARFIGEQAVQLHGAIGLTDELSVGHYFKRISAIDIQLGDSSFHLMRFAETK